jgi:excisionase family DNA binding protein
MLQLTASEAAEVEAFAEELKTTRPVVAYVLRRVLKNARVPRHEYLTTGEAAALLGVTAQTVRNWADRKWLASERVRPLGRRHIAKAAVEEMLAFRRDVEAGGVLGLTDDEIDEEIRLHRQERSTRSAGDDLNPRVCRSSRSGAVASTT